MQKKILPLIVVILSALTTQSWAETRIFPKEKLTQSGVTGGLVVHIGNDKGKTIANLLAGNSYLVHGLYPNKDNVDQARDYLKQKNLYGKVTLQHWNQDYLPYADNTVNLLINESVLNILDEEVLRVLTPNGKAYMGSGRTSLKTVKPKPSDIDEWTHYLHGPDNNAVANDNVVGNPTHVQWIADPKFSRSHDQLASVSAMVSANGRVFYIVDQGQAADIRMPARWSLIARDAFNGVLLWKKTIDSWFDHMHHFRAGPPDLPFRLAAVDNRVYVTLGHDKPVTALDAATGKTLTTFKGTEQTRQIINTGKQLIMLAGTSQVYIQSNPAKPAKRSIIAANPNTGEILWCKDVTKNTLLPMAVSNNSLLYQTTKHLICLNIKSGDENWKIDHSVILSDPRKKSWEWAAPTLTTYDGIVYVADFKTLSAISVDNGKQLWTSTSRQGFCSSPDIFIIDNILWRGTTERRQSSDFREGLDPKTGKVVKTLETEKAWAYPTLAHYRCYRPKATNRFILSSRSGIEFIDVDSGKINLNHWIRGTCQYGIMPANGLVYAPPHSCACNIKTMFRGMVAMAPKQKILQRTDTHFEKGPAYGNIPKQQADNWPAFRHDNQRSGKTNTKVPTNLKPLWKANIGTRLSSPVASNSTVFVADIDAHTIYALDETDGTEQWSFTANGRVDSPPTIYNGTVLFGSVDGWVYCLRQTDGKLAWRFRAAPEDRYIVNRGQLESAWPIHGSVLVSNGTLIVSAGRSSYIDSGIYIYKLDPATGTKIAQTVINSLDQDGEQPAGGVDLRGVLNDILTASADDIYMRHLKIDFETGDDLQIGSPHLFAPMGFLDDNWWLRSYWIYGTDPVCMPAKNESGWAIWPRVGNMLPSGRILVMNNDTVFGYGRDKYPDGSAGQIRGGEKYHLFAAEKKLNQPLPSNKENQHLRAARSGQALGLKPTERDKRGGGPSLHNYLWTKQSPIFVRALVLAETKLLIAGPPEPEDLRSSNMKLQDGDRSEAAYLGKQGALLCIVDATDGKQLAEYKLKSPPVFDGMIAADSRVFISSQDGSISCFGQSLVTASGLPRF